MSFNGEKLDTRKSLALRDPGTQSKVDQLNRLNIDTVILMREINQDLVDINNIIRKTLMPVISKYGENCEQIRQSVEIWKQFFEASANVDLEGVVDEERDPHDVINSDSHVFDVGRRSLGASTPNRIDTSPVKVSGDTLLSPTKSGEDYIRTGDLFNVTKQMHRGTKSFKVQLTPRSHRLQRPLQQIQNHHSPRRQTKKPRHEEKEDDYDDELGDSPSLHPPVLESEMQYSPIRKKPGVFNKYTDPTTLPNLKFGSKNPDNSDSYSASLTQQPVLSEYGRLQTQQQSDGNSQSLDPVAPPTLTALSMGALSAVPEESSELAIPKLAFDEKNPFKE